MITDKIVEELKAALTTTNGKIPMWFIEDQARKAKVTYMKLSPNMRVCVMKLPFGAEVLGVAQVLDAKNDVEIIGNETAFADAKSKLWDVFGVLTLALTLNRLER